ncbi:hypothetical protein J2T08_000570 [Neorhizobium galegae]|uniref:hypothetical protein n=1 Tax=Neorhizobium galegae TaxID=399 RepID=UPI002785634D|nr:hypothetical protein [Neorhizobium galegae]MDQ0132669.1 hypothetical protein [Neorhizobium galegae]
MTITAADARFTEYNPLVPTTDFAADFPVFGVDDLAVYVDDVQRFDFTVTASFTDGISNDAKVILLSGVIGSVYVVGARAPHRTNRFTNGAPVPTRDLNLAFDTVEGELQEAGRDIGRAIKAPVGSPGYEIDADIASGSLLVVDGTRVKAGPDIGAIGTSIEDAIAAAAAAAGSAAAAEVSEDNAAASAMAANNAVGDAQEAADEAAALVVQATAGFAGFLDGQGYDFGLISDPTTYFNQNWGTL